MVMMKNIYIITGGPGFGKTSVIKELRRRSFNGSEELSRQFIKEQIREGRKLLPWVDRLGYSEEMLRRRVRQYNDTSQDELWFFDRGIPDLIAYIIKDGFEVPEMYFEVAGKCRYSQTVFLTPPWEEIHKNDSERMESFEEAETIHREILATYESLGYNCVAIPKTTVTERVGFILNIVDQQAAGIDSFRR